MDSNNQMTKMILDHIVKIVGALGGILILGGITLAFFPELVGNHKITFGGWKIETDQAGFAMAGTGAVFVTILLCKTLDVLVKLKSACAQVSERLTFRKTVKAHSEV